MNSVSETRGTTQGRPVRQGPQGLTAYRNDEGQPVISHIFGGLATHAEVKEFIELAQTYIAQFSDAVIAHSDNKFCGIPDCQTCKVIEQRHKLQEVLENEFPVARGAKNQAGSVYIFRAGPVCKVGKSIKPLSRLKQIQKQIGQEVELIHAVRTPNCFELELHWHRRFAAHHTTGEWFALPQSAIDEFCAQGEMRCRYEKPHPRNHTRRYPIREGASPVCG